MPASFCKFVFSGEVSKRFVEDSIACSVLLAEYAFGKAKVRLDAAYTVADEPPRCLIDASTEVGRYLAENLADTMMKLRGERSFEVFKVDEWKL
jgi:hypothetical protein